LLVGLKDAGVDLAGADAVVGTSAGSVVGFTLASGGDLTEATTQVSGGAAIADAGPAPAAGGADGLGELMATIAQAAQDPADADRHRAALGAIAVATPTITEDVWLSMFATFADADWPAAFSCTAVDTATGRFRIWDADSGVAPQLAIASSCAVPAIFPPVSILGARWMDGGVRDMVNADVASGHDAVVVVSCTLLDIPKELSTPELDAVFGATVGQIDGLRSGGSKVETVVPGAEMLEISGFGLNLMDFTRAAAAFEAGVRQGKEEATRIGAIWS
jgi:NTE family protein